MNDVIFHDVKFAVRHQGAMAGPLHVVVFKGVVIINGGRPLLRHPNTNHVHRFSARITGTMSGKVVVVYPVVGSGIGAGKSSDN